ncbi:MAG: hypothetical protein KAS72_10360 [Phycisphaerales bacterium]|nr:hypothetical protein [Phycisphaerales bacterium]
MSSANCSPTQLDRLIRRLEREMPEVAEPDRSPIDELIFSLLLYDTNTAKAEAAMRKLRRDTIDDNDLRVTLDEDLVKIISDRYPKALQRVRRIKATLGEIYLREYEVTLEPLMHKTKRDARTYLASLEGMAPFAADRVMLLRIIGHAIPVDDQLLSHLVAEGVFEESVTLREAKSFLERHIRAANAIATYLRLQAWSEERMAKPRTQTSRSTAASSPKRKKTTGA